MIIIYIKSPINYTGGKYKLLSEIVPLFPTKIDNFIDLFGGGADVSININANKIIYNDRVEPLVGMLKWISENDFDTINNQVIEVVNKYGLSMTNTDGFTLLRSDYNNNLIDKNLSLFVLNCYCFNNTSRFNIKGEFNQAFGKNRSCYNPKIKKNLFLMCEAFNSKDIIFENKDFYSVDFDFLTGHDLAYCDPPYLLSDAWYNKGGGGWSINDDIRLFELLDKLNDKGVKFALSNVIEHKGKKHELLIDWASKYKTNYLNKKYKNCCYTLKANKFKTQEVLITNY